MKKYISLDDLEAAWRKDDFNITIARLGNRCFDHNVPIITDVEICGEYAKRVQHIFADFIDYIIKEKPEITKDKEYVIRAGNVLMDMMLDALKAVREPYSGTKEEFEKEELKISEICEETLLNAFADDVCRSIKTAVAVTTSKKNLVKFTGKITECLGESMNNWAEKMKGEADGVSVH